MRRNSISTTSLVSLGNTNGTESQKSRRSSIGSGRFSFVPFLGSKKGGSSLGLPRGKSSCSLMSLDGVSSSGSGYCLRKPVFDSSTSQPHKQKTLRRNSKSMLSLKSLGEESSSACFSRLATPSAILKLEELDDDLEKIGSSHRDFLVTKRTTRTPSIDENSEDENSQSFSSSKADDSKSSSSRQPKNRIERVHRNDFHRVCFVGRGCYSDVYMVTNHKREQFALKALNSSRIKSPQNLVTAAIDLAMEAKILSETNHENIIQLRGICSTTFSHSYTEGTDEGYFLILDLLKEVLSDSLERWRKDSRLSSAFENKWSIAKPKMNIKKMYGRMQSVALGIANGMMYLHEQGIVIRDLKPANVGFDNDGKVRLFDFGMARKLEDCDPDEMCGSPRYMAPEVMAGEGYSLKTDVYSFGIILYELCSLTVAFDIVKKHSSVAEFNRLVIDHTMRPKLGRIACPSTTTLIEDCWQTDPTKRPSFEEVYRRIVGITSCNNTVMTFNSNNEDESADNVSDLSVDLSTLSERPTQ